MLIARAELHGRGELDVRIAGGRVAEIGPGLERRPGEERIDAAGGALLPGLHDHHIHLLSLAAARQSVRCGPPHVRSREDLARALRTAPGEGWLRGVGYHDSVAGPLDRDALDALAGGRPARIQHRSGALWILSSSACDAAGLDAGADHPGVERDARGRATGRAFAADAWLRRRIPDRGAPDLAAVGRELARCGVTGVTDATAGNGASELAVLAGAVRSGALPQQLRLMGTDALPADCAVARGEVKIMLRENALPDLAELTADIATVHAAGRAVAIHCVTRSELVVASAALSAAGGVRGDRIEHASVAPPDLVKLLVESRVTVVTQPGFVAERGDAYLAEVETRDRPWLYRGRGFLDAGVPLGGGSDAPFGEPDPWRAMRAAVERRTAGGAPFEPGEALTPEEALALFTTPPDAPGGAPRCVEPGAEADLCLLDRPWAEARRALSRDAVRTTLRAGQPVFEAPVEAS